MGEDEHAPRRVEVSGLVEVSNTIHRFCLHDDFLLPAKSKTPTRARHDLAEMVLIVPDPLKELALLGRDHDSVLIPPLDGRQVKCQKSRLPKYGRNSRSDFRKCICVSTAAVPQLPIG